MLAAFIIYWEIKIFITCGKIREIKKSTYIAMVSLHVLDLIQLISWAYTLIMAISGVNMMGLFMKVVFHLNWRFFQTFFRFVLACTMPLKMDCICFNLLLHLIDLLWLLKWCDAQQIRVLFNHGSGDCLRFYFEFMHYFDSFSKTYSRSLDIILCHCPPHALHFCVVYGKKLLRILLCIWLLLGHLCWNIVVNNLSNWISPTIFCVLYTWRICLYHSYVIHCKKFLSNIYLFIRFIF